MYSMNNVATQTPNSDEFSVEEPRLSHTASASKRPTCTSIVARVSLLPQIGPARPPRDYPGVLRRHKC